MFRPSAAAIAFTVPLLLLAHPARAEEPAARIEVPETYLRQIERDPDNFLKSRVQDLYRYNPFGTVTQKDVDKVRRFEHARQRSNILARYFAFDLDGDGMITRQEFDATPSTADQVGKPQVDLAFSQSDSDGDGRLSYAELVAHADAELERQNARGPRPDDNPLMFDLNGDGRVDVKEMTAAVGTLAANPTTIAQGSSSVLKTGAVVCALPSASKAAEVVIVSAYEGDGLSSVAVNGVGEETSTATLVVEPGKAPLYIFAVGFESMVWNVTGATGRVERFVVQPRSTQNGPGAGVVGVDRSKVGFVSPGGCGKYATKPQDAAGILLKSTVAAALGRDVDHFVASYKLGQVTLPSGVVSKKAPSTDEPVSITTSVGTLQIEDGELLLDGKAVPDRLAAELLRFNPRGLVKFNASDVVASAPVTAYDILPQQAGLAQLVLSGHLTLTTDHYYVIEKTFPYFPAGLNGAHSVKFLLRKGVQMPGGSPGHSSVISEETRECLTRVCR